MNNDFGVLRTLCVAALMAVGLSACCGGNQEAGGNCHSVSFCSSDMVCAQTKKGPKCVTMEEAAKDCGFVCFSRAKYGISPGNWPSSKCKAPSNAEEGFDDWDHGYENSSEGRCVSATDIKSGKVEAEDVHDQIAFYERIIFHVDDMLTRDTPWL